MPVDLSQLDSILTTYQDTRGALIPILQKTQQLFGFLPESAISYLAEKLNLAPSEIYGVATFYTQFRFSPLGKYIVRICHGTACHVNDADSLDVQLETELGIKEGETTQDGLFTFLKVSCLGCCSLAPAVMINDKTYGNLTPDTLKATLNIYRKKG